MRRTRPLRSPSTSLALWVAAALMLPLTGTAFGQTTYTLGKTPAGAYSLRDITVPISFDASGNITDPLGGQRVATVSTPGLSGATAGTGGVAVNRYHAVVWSTDGIGRGATSRDFTFVPSSVPSALCGVPAPTSGTATATALSSPALICGITYDSLAGGVSTSNGGRIWCLVNDATLGWAVTEYFPAPQPAGGPPANSFGAAFKLRDNNGAVLPGGVILADIAFDSTTAVGITQGLLWGIDQTGNIYQWIVNANPGVTQWNYAGRADFTATVPVGIGIASPNMHGVERALRPPPRFGFAVEDAP